MSDNVIVNSKSNSQSWQQQSIWDNSGYNFEVWIPQNKYTRENLIAKITEMVEDSEFLPRSLIWRAEELYDIEKLEKLLIYVYDSYIKEKKMDEGSKNIIRDKLTTFYKKTATIYQNATKWFIRFIEEKDRKKEERDIKKMENLFSWLL